VARLAVVGEVTAWLDVLLEPDRIALLVWSSNLSRR